ncbi:hypothetical protein SASPL_145183 [Salvia splendens]|uniref:Uncharacterized protein n=1 Tax=Salvia splendens TaxID=180675 RepID=A0A8X8WHS3_SALSN|nr:hypothetical protein SASPL_145183 [Salvia splendens]
MVQREARVWVTAMVRREARSLESMDYEKVKKFIEKTGGPYEFTVDSMPERFIEPMVMQGMKIDHIERGRIAL